MVTLTSPPDHVARDAQLVSLFLDELRSERPPWAADGLCTEYPDLSWFPTRGEPVDAQKAGVRSSTTPPSPSRCSTGCCTGPSSSTSTAKATACAPQKARADNLRKPLNPKHT